MRDNKEFERPRLPKPFLWDRDLLRGGADNLIAQRCEEWEGDEILGGDQIAALPLAGLTILLDSKAAREMSDLCMQHVNHHADAKEWTPDATAAIEAELQGIVQVCPGSARSHPLHVIAHLRCIAS